MEPGPVSTARPTKSCERMRASRGTSHEKSRAVVRSEHRKPELAPLSHQPVALSFVTDCGDPQPADHTPSGRPRPAPPALRSVPLPLHSASLTSLHSWRLPGHLLLSGLSDDHDRLRTRRSSSAGECSSRRALHRAPRTEGWHKATPQTTPTAHASRSSRPLRGRAVEGDRPGRRDRPVSLRPGCGRVKEHPPVWGNIEATTCHDTTPTGGRGRLGY